jgi:hypothetical protein
LRLEDAICWTYQRIVTNANTVSVEGTQLQLEFPPADPGWAGRRVEIAQRLDGSWLARSFAEIVPAFVITDNHPKRVAAA